MTTSEIHSYDAATAPRGILKHVLPILGYPKVIAENTSILANFFRRDLFGRFRGSFLGIFWVLIQPMFVFTIYYFVFGFLFAHRTQVGPNVEFALFLFSGIIAFTSFTESTNRSCSVVLENGNLVKKVRFPAELLPLPHIMVSMITYTVGASVFLVVGFTTGRLDVGPHMLAWPLVVIVQAVLTLGIGLALACLQVLMRDTSHLYSLFTQAWFFLTPVFWWPAMLEEKLGKLAWILEINPMYSLVQAHRLSLGFMQRHAEMRHFGGLDARNNPLPGEPLASVWHYLGTAAIWAAVFLVLGYSFFTSRKNKFSDLV